MVGRKVRLQIRRWQNKPASARKMLWLAPMRDGAPHLIFEGEQTHDILVDTPELESIVDRACRGGGFEEVPIPERKARKVEREVDPLA